MELIEKLRKIMADEYGIKTDEELNKAFDAMDTTIFELLGNQKQEVINA